MSDDDDKKHPSERRTVTLPVPSLTLNLPAAKKPSTGPKSGPKPAAAPPEIPTGMSFQVDLGSIASPPKPPVVGGAAVERTAISTTVRPDYLPAGTELNSWVVEEKLGAGGMGAVYRVRHTRSSSEAPELAALKVSLPPANETNDARHAREVRFKREYAAIAALDHPNIVQPEEFFRWPTRDGYLCMVMPYVVGHTLDAHLMREHPSFRALLSQLMRPLADAIDYIHAKNVFHRDIKPANIMVRSKDGVPLLMDFGIARSKAAATLTVSEMLTTFEYSAPEYLAYIGSEERAAELPFDYGAQSDIFCFGAAFFSLLTGYLPYSHVDGAHGPAGMMSLPFQRALKVYVPRSARSMNAAIPIEVDELLAKMMTRDLTARFASGGALVDAIDAVLEALPLESPEWDADFIPPERQRDKKPPKSEPARVPDSGGNTKVEGPSRTGSVKEPSLGLPLPDMSAGLQLPPLPPSAVEELRRESTFSQRPASEAPGGFSPPTASAQKPGFASVIRAAPPVQAPVSPDALPPELLEAQKRLASPKPVVNQKGLLVGAGAVIVVLLILVVASAGAPPVAPTTTSLLDEKDVKTEPTQPPPPMNPAVLEKPVEPVPVEAAVEEQKPLVVSTGGNAKSSVRRGNSDAKAIDEELKAQFGGERPTVGGSGGVVPKKKSWVAGLDEDAASAGEKQKLGIPTGTEIPVRLMKPLDSRTTGSGPAIAKLSRAFTMRGEVLLPSGTMVYGVATAASAGRFDVSFSKLKLPDGRELDFKAIAYDNDDKKPGLQPSTRTQATGSSKGSSVAGTVLKNTAASAIGLIPGDGAADLAKGAGQAVVQGAGQTTGGGQAQELLLLEAPADFSLFVAEPF